MVFYTLDEQIQNFTYTKFSQSIQYCPVEYSLHLNNIYTKTEIVKPDPNEVLYKIEQPVDSTGMIIFQNERDFRQFFNDTFILEIKVTH